MTGNQFIDSVCNELEEDTYKSTGSKASISQEKLNDTLRDMLNRHPFTWRVATDPMTIPTVINQTVYSLIQGSVKVQDFLAVILDTGDLQTIDLEEKSLQTYIECYPNVEYQASTYPEVYAKLGSDSLKLAPRPSSIWNLRIFYIPEFVDITNFAAEVAVPNRILETIKLGLTARLQKSLREYEKSVANYTLYETSLKTLINEDKTNPNLTFKFRGMGSGTYPSNYWASPFVKRIT